MQSQRTKWFFLLCLWPLKVEAEDIPIVSMHFHTQWDVGEKERKWLQENYGLSRVNFDEKGHPVPHGLSPEQTLRWKRFYDLCMKDGCAYCDAAEGLGSCESGNCGPHNAYCKPYLNNEGLPVCGRECADYAFKSSLI